MAAILAVTEQRQGALRKVSLEAVAAARLIADALGATVDAIVLGAGPVEGVTGLGPSGADRVLHATHEGFGLYNPDGYAATIASIGGSYAAVVFAASATGRDLAPRVAAKLRTACATDVTARASGAPPWLRARECRPRCRHCGRDRC